MGVAGLWEVLRPAAKNRSLTELAVTDGFQNNPHGVRGYRLGIDASIWLFHMEGGKEGENPHLRTLYFRCAKLMQAPFLPLFVFDGPKRPDFKRGKKVNKAGNVLVPSMKDIIEAFGFEHRTAPGEAEAELAYLNQIGVIDGILSDDVDNFLFGAMTVVRNSSNTLSGNRANPALNAAGKDDKNHSWSFNFNDIASHTQLTRGGLILIAMLSGGDYHDGLRGCGMKIAVALAKCGFGDTLYQAALNHSPDSLGPFLDSWRAELRHEIKTNSRGLIGRKSPSLANSLTNEFPHIPVLMSYVNPVTSKSMGKPYKAGDIRWTREPDISKLAAICERFFEWGYRESIIKRFRTVIWTPAVLRILRRAVLDIDEGRPSTPTRKAALQCGTPSRMIARHFSSMDIDQSTGDEDRLIVKIHSSREHLITDKILEYRLEIAPAQLVRLAEQGILGTRQKPDNEWADDEEVEKDAEDQASKNPDDHLRIWMPACMVRLVEPGLVRDFEEVEAKKAAKKAGKGQGRGKKKKAVEEEDEGSDTASPPKPKAKPRAKKAAPAPTLSSDDEEDVGELPTVPAAPKARKRSAQPVASTSKIPAKPKNMSSMLQSRLPQNIPGLSSDSDDEDIDMPSPSRLFQGLHQKTHSSKLTSMMHDLDEEPDDFAEPPPSSQLDLPDDPIIGPSPSPRRRQGIRDLTKKKSSSSLHRTGSTSSGPGGSSQTSIFSSTTTNMWGSQGVLSVPSSPEKPSRLLSSTILSSFTQTSTSQRTTTTASTSTSTASKAPPPRKPAPAPFMTFYDDVPEKRRTAHDNSFNSDDLFTDDSPRNKSIAYELDDDDSFFASPVRTVLKRNASTSNKETKNIRPDSARPTASSSTLPNAQKTTASTSSSKQPSNKSELNSEVLSIASSSASESETQARYRKSPRKSASHKSPAFKNTSTKSKSNSGPSTSELNLGSNASIHTSTNLAHPTGRGRANQGSSSRLGRDKSPTPQTKLNLLHKKPLSKTGVLGAPKKMGAKDMPIYEISSDEDDDGKTAAPLVSSSRAKGKVKSGGAGVGESGSGKRSQKANTIAFIDLT